MADQYKGAVTGPQIDAALLDMANHTSEAWAVGTRGGVPVSSGDDTYQKNAKYWAEQAESTSTSLALFSARYMWTDGRAITAARNTYKSIVGIDGDGATYDYIGLVSNRHYFVCPYVPTYSGGQPSFKVMSVSSTGTNWSYPTTIDLVTLNELSAKANLDSPTFTGTPKAPTPDASDSSTRLATTKFVSNKVDDLTEQIEEVAENINATLIEESSSGSIVSISDGADGIPMKSFVVNFAPKQSGSGDPSPTNIRPISGWDGVTGYVTSGNLFAYGDVTIDAANKSVYFATPLPAGQYTLGLTVTSNDTDAINCLVLGYYDNGTSFQHIFSRDTRQVWTFTASRPMVRFIFYASDSYSHGVGDLAAWSDIQLDSGSTAGEFTGYGNSYPVTWTDVAGTVYGGYICLVTGKLYATWSKVTPSYRGNSVTSIGSSVYFDVPNSLPSMYALMSNVAYVGQESAALLAEHPLTCRSYSNNLKRIVIWGRLADYPTTSSVITALNDAGAEFAYELATPIEYDLTTQTIPTLLGTNNVWSDGESVEITYRADTKLYVDNKIAELQALILEH